MHYICVNDNTNYRCIYLRIFRQILFNWASELEYSDIRRVVMSGFLLSRQINTLNNGYYLCVVFFGGTFASFGF